LNVGTGEGLDKLRRVASRGGSLRILYNADLDSVSAASIVLAASRRLGIRAVARPYNLVLDLSKVRNEVFEEDLLLVIGLLVKGEPAALGIKDIMLVEPGEYAQRREQTVPGPASAALSALNAFGDGSPLQLIRSVVGYYATRCYLSDAPCDEVTTSVISRGGDLLDASPETLMSTLRMFLPIDESIHLTLYPNLAFMIGDVPSISEGLRDAGVCRERCPTLDEIESKRDLASALRSYMSGVLPQDLFGRVFSRRIGLRPSAGVLSDLSDLSLLEEMLALRDGPQRALSDSLSAYPGVVREGIRSLVEASKSISRWISQARKSASKGARAIVVDDLDVSSATPAEVFLKSATFPIVEGDQLLIVRIKSGIGGSYLVSGRRRAPVDGLLAEADGMGAHHIWCGVLARLWVPSEEDRRFLSLIS
jgi:hypothetical protein